MRIAGSTYTRVRKLITEWASHQPKPCLQSDDCLPGSRGTNATNDNQTEHPIALHGNLDPHTLASADAQDHPPLGKLIDVGGYRVHLYCIGSGSPAVVIVGAGYSFDWVLVQPDVSKFTQVCAYDHSGIAWSDPGPTDSCSLRVSEVHSALKNAKISGPFVLVGHSLGALVARLYAAKYADDVAGMVIVDHALHGTACFAVGRQPAQYGSTRSSQGSSRRPRP